MKEVEISFRPDDEVPFDWHNAPASDFVGMETRVIGHPQHVTVMIAQESVTTDVDGKERELLLAMVYDNGDPSMEKKGEDQEHEYLVFMRDNEGNFLRAHKWHQDESYVFIQSQYHAIELGYESDRVRPVYTPDMRVDDDGVPLDSPFILDKRYIPPFDDATMDHETYTALLEAEEERLWIDDQWTTYQHSPVRQAKRERQEMAVCLFSLLTDMIENNPSLGEQLREVERLANLVVAVEV